MGLKRGKYSPNVDACAEFCSEIRNRRYEAKETSPFGELSSKADVFLSSRSVTSPPVRWLASLVVSIRLTYLTTPQNGLVLFADAFFKLVPAYIIKRVKDEVKPVFEEACVINKLTKSPEWVPLTFSVKRTKPFSGVVK